MYLISNICHKNKKGNWKLEDQEYCSQFHIRIYYDIIT